MYVQLTTSKTYKSVTINEYNWPATSMLETKCVGDKFEILVTNIPKISTTSKFRRKLPKPTNNLKFPISQWLLVTNVGDTNSSYSLYLHATKMQPKLSKGLNLVEIFNLKLLLENGNFQKLTVSRFSQLHVCRTQSWCKVHKWLI